MTKDGALIDRLAAQLRECTAEIAALQVRAAEVSADRRGTYERHLNDLEKRRIDLIARADAVREADAHRVETLSQALKPEIDELRMALSDAKSRFH
ncbi:MAG: hypothetical protein HKM95_08855 [Inquilinus sp.]|nr:hypothetical protein [Inquilinus sp.]